MSKYFKFRRDELPKVADLLKKSFLRDQKVFKKFSPDFNKEYWDRLDKQMDLVSKLVNSKTLSLEVKKLTKDIDGDIKKLRYILERIQAYAQRSRKELTLNYMDFGCREARKEARLGHVNEMVGCINTVNENIKNNHEALTSHGLKEKYVTQIKELSEKITSHYTLREQKRHEREQQVTDNLKEFDTLWKILHDLSRTGRMLFKERDEKKMKDYMFTHILKKLRTKSVKKKVKKKKSVTTQETVTPKVEPQTAELH